ncbi:MAG: tRNA pseudouridine(38-40) synthase TruA [Syntrophales bacterium]|jgi:tRNA pseudouridine38-40 synthase
MTHKKYKYKVIIEYDGTPYRGWQVQKNARTVQGVMLEAADDLFGAPVDIQGAGRTDAGVHALAQVAHMEVPRRMPPRVILEQLNERLPSSINILHAEEVPVSFHARHDAEGRSYIYVISRYRTAFGKRYVWWIRENLDLAKMQAACTCFRGFHNFSSFADRRRDPNGSAMVQLDHISMMEEDGLIIFRIAASHFLWRMVRRIIGVVVKIGQGRLSPTVLPQLLDETSDLPARLTAPASGLFLEGVIYNGRIAEPSISPAFPFPLRTGCVKLFTR